ncbi:MAG: polymer-forming cytoskeletal protein [Bacillota bacterium]
MFKKKEAANFDKIDTIIGKGTAFHGNIKAEGTLRVDGKIEGEIESQGDILIGESGVVIGGIKARNILVAGIIKGDVVISGRIEIASSGKLEGDINTSSLIIDEGALFQGSCQMVKASVQEKRNT